MLPRQRSTGPTTTSFDLAAHRKAQSQTARVALGSGTVSPEPFESLVTKLGDGASEVSVVNLTVAQVKKQGAGPLTELFANGEDTVVHTQDELTQASMDRARYWALASAGRYPNLLGEPSPTETEWAVDGVPFPWEKYSELGRTARNDAFQYLQNRKTGVGDFYDQDTFEEAHLREFNEFFSKGDG